MECFDKYLPPIISIPILDTVTIGRRFEAVMKGRIAMISDDKYRTKVLRNLHSNNWLKMHGYPMKRKGV